MHQYLISPSLLFFSLLLLLIVSNVYAIRHLFPTELNPGFMEAPEYRNGFICGDSVVHIAMTLDPHYLRGTIAAVHSILKHSSCPENMFLHFLTSANQEESLKRTVQSTFPSLSLNVYGFDESVVSPLISSSIREALDDPLNYARIYLADILDPAVERVIYLDSDVLVVDDIQKLWNITLGHSTVVGAPEYCHANFTKYFTDEFWSDKGLSGVFDDKTACYFNTGVMVMDLVRWRAGGFTSKIETWMKVQKERRIYELGSLPPFLLVFGGEVERIHHRWNQHGLGGDNLSNSCRALHPGAVSLLHWSGKGKPWVRLDSNNPCPVDYLWEPYDLHTYHHQRSLL